MGKETPGVGVGAIGATVNGSDLDIEQALARQDKQIGQPLSFLMRPECSFSPRIVLDEGSTYFLPDFERCRTNRRPEEGQQFLAGALHRLDSIFDHTGCETAPARVHGSNDSPTTIAQQNWKTVRSHDRAYDVLTPCRGRVSLQRLLDLLGADNIVAMNLA